VDLVRQSRSGPGAARNAGIKAATGALLAFLDADDWWLPHRLASQLPIMLSGPDLAMVHSAFEAAAPDGSDRPVYRFSQADCDVHVLKRSCRVGTLTVLVRREVVERLGGFDPSLRRCQDWDLWIRIARDYRIVYHDEPVAVYRPHSGQVRSDFLMRYRFSSMVLRRYRKVHLGCAECEDAYRAGLLRERNLLRDGAHALLGESRAACEQGAYTQAVRALAQALRCDPALSRTRLTWHTAAVIAKRSLLGSPRR
jgi:glycosyltransferase involved in cell wall biosynthesis